MVRATRLQVSDVDGGRYVSGNVYTDGSAILQAGGRESTAFLHLTAEEFRALVLQGAEALGIVAVPQDETVGHDKGLRPHPDHIRKVRAEIEGGGGC